MNKDHKFVEFHKYCPTCKHESESERIFENTELLAEALDMAIEALSCSDEPNRSDLINRQDVLDAINECSKQWMGSRNFCPNCSVDIRGGEGDFNERGEEWGY